MTTDNRKVPSRDDIIQMVSREMYSGKILNNAHRGHVVEAMVLSALSPDHALGPDQWRLTALGWHPWDLQRGKGEDRVRIQVKQCAWLQLWTPKNDKEDLRLHFVWKKSRPRYFKRDYPDEDIEREGWFCDMFVFGVHEEKDRDRADQVDPDQWTFLVIPAHELREDLKSLSLEDAKAKWPPVSWSGLAESVESAISKWRSAGA